ncbi:MAG: hypothetical protein IJC40_01820 [Muribaculaceae bacterium]|nr:hypothetical protein [Muribaculaceae bacterium]
MEHRTRRHIVISLLMFALFVSYQAGITLFVHSHNVGGSIVAHSHPYSGGSHTHSGAEYVAIHNLSSFQSGEIESEETITVYRQVIDEITILTDENRNRYTDKQIISLRAPPCFC